MTTSQKVYVLEVNATGMNTVKNQQNYFGVRKTIRSSKNTIKKLIVDDKEITDQIYIL